MEAALAVARSSGVPIPQGPSAREDQNPSAVSSWLLRLRAAQQGALEMELRLHEARDRAVSAPVADPAILRANLERLREVEAMLDRLCERSSIAELVAQLRQPFIGDFVVAHASSHRDAVSLIDGAVDEMADLPAVLRSVCAAGDLPSLTADGGPPPPLPLLQSAASYLARCQQYHEAMSITRAKAPLHPLRG